MEGLREHIRPVIGAPWEVTQCSSPISWGPSTVSVSPTPPPSLEPVFFPCPGTPLANDCPVDKLRFNPTPEFPFRIRELLCYPLQLTSFISILSCLSWPLTDFSKEHFPNKLFAPNTCLKVHFWETPSKSLFLVSLSSTHTDALFLFYSITETSEATP